MKFLQLINPIFSSTSFKYKMLFKESKSNSTRINVMLEKNLVLKVLIYFEN